jgi:ubiquitin carboxyl-terminal hydrolase 4/11/15
MMSASSDVLPQNGNLSLEKDEPDLRPKVNDRSIHYKEEGNMYFSLKDYPKSATAYKLALALYEKESQPELEVALRSNLAMTLLKIDDYETARNECNLALSILLQSPRPGDNQSQQHAKLLYRRALANEGLQEYDESLEDLQQCLSLMQEVAETTNALENMKQAAQKKLNNIQQSQTRSQVDAFEQRKIILTLLENRKSALEPRVTKEGEAMFLLEWNWWQQFCLRVGFDLGQLIELLPPGAVRPDQDVKVVEELGPIDNSSLLLDLDTPFRQHWYPPSQTLKPNLVRGFHYEIIPREVYQALSTWYTESSIPICRRSNAKEKLQIYQWDATPKVRHSCCGACGAPYAKSRCTQCLDIYYCGRPCQEAHWSFHRQVCGRVDAKKNVVPGRVGLHNLGNTCFMNSPLQCLFHATPLSRHFLSNAYLEDLNVNNPLGSGGKLAREYNRVLQEIYMGAPKATSPTALKRAISLFAPRFAGMNQHDAQEFLAYLLDGLHEDLNRIRKAPYVEFPDVDETTNMAIAGAEAWSGHERRNSSLVMETFYGQFKSTCVCPQCERVSVSFDAFNHISLEIPQPQPNRFIPITVFGRQGKVPVRWMFEVSRGSLVAELRQMLSKECDIPIERLALCDLYQYTVYEILQDKKNVNTIRNTDFIAAFDVDPYTETTVHVIGTNSVAGNLDDANDNDDDKKSEEDVGKDSQLFGLPFLTSFSADFSCRQVYQHLWEQVAHVKGVRQEWMQVCITESNGRARGVFDKSAILPADSDEKVARYLGKDCTERFLFCTLQWNPDAPLNKSAFLAVIDHPSYQEAVEKHRAMMNARNKIVTLDQCFQTFTRPERLDQNNKWYCNKCKEHVRAMKTMELWRLPNILIVHLKRFEFKHALRRDKLDTFVDFPLQELNMSNYCSNSHSPDDFVQDDIPALYDLFAVTNHFGRLGFGHYTAFARSWDEQGMDSEWALFDDSSVRSVDADNVVSPAAYVLFYRRRNFN